MVKKMVYLLLDLVFVGWLFYLVFFVAAPAGVALIPQSPWHSLLSFFVYIIIAYIGGIGLPIVIGFLIAIFIFS